MKTVLYCRVSSKEQEETGYSLPAQEKLLRSYSTKHNLKTIKVFAISESASGKQQRQTFNQMMTFVKKERIMVVVCEKVDRLTRNFKDAVIIDDWLERNEDRQVHLVKDSLILHKNSRSQEKLNWGIRILFAKNYIDNLSEEVKKGQREKISQGWFPTRPPIGYKTIGEKGKKIHVINTDTSPLIQKMFKLYASKNHSLKSLVEKMYGDGLRSSNGQKIAKSSLHNLLTNPFYAGEIRWNDKIYPAAHEPLISKNLFKQVQQLLNSKTTPKYNKHNYLLKGMIRCSECKGTITWETQKGHVYGHCNHYKNCTQTTWSKEPDVTKQLTKGLDQLAINNSRLANWILKALKEGHQDQVNYHNTSLESLRKRQDTLKRRLDIIYDDKLDEKIEEDFYERKFQQYSQEISQIDENLQKHTLSNKKHYQLGINIFKTSQQANLTFSQATNINKKRDLLHLVFQDLKLNEGQLTYNYTPTFQILHQAVAKTNSSKVAKSDKILNQIFEPSEKNDTKDQTNILEQHRSTLLPGLDSNQ
jgi:site-specific DNA recombinase